MGAWAVVAIIDTDNLILYGKHHFVGIERFNVSSSEHGGDRQGYVISDTRGLYFRHVNSTFHHVKTSVHEILPLTGSFQFVAPLSKCLWQPP